MGFDPRDRSRGPQPRQQQRVTSNIDSLLAENLALRHEVSQLRQELERLRRRSRSASFQQPFSRQEPEVEAPRFSEAQVQGWGEALAKQKGWKELRRQSLDALIERVNRSSFPPSNSLQERLDRLVPGLGRDLLLALGNSSKKRSAVLAAFAVYGVRASEWLDEAPQRVVAALRQRQHLGSDPGQQRHREGRRTRTDQRSSDRPEPQFQQTSGRDAALAMLGLQPGASLESIKQAHRRLVKKHHPDLGGSAETFCRVMAAYQLLVE